MSRMPVDRPQGRTAVVDALVRSAQRLIAEHGSSGVGLREIAEDARVNFGLVYHHVGTKEQLLSEVYRRAAENLAVRLRDLEHLDDAVDLFMRAGDGTTARLVGWAVLEDPRRDAFLLASPAMGILADLVERDAEESGAAVSREQAQIFAALTMVICLGWTLFGPIALAAADLDVAEANRYSPLVRSLVRRFANEVTGKDGT